MDMMNRYVSPPPVWPFRMAVAAAAAGTLAVFLMLLAYRHHSATVTLQVQSDRLKAAQIARPVQKVSRAALEEKKRWDSLKAEREFNWAPLFVALERSANGNIELLEVRPDKSSRSVLLRGEARDQDALAAYLESMGRQAALSNVHLTHQLKKKRDRLETYSFEMKATLLN